MKRSIFKPALQAFALLLAVLFAAHIGTATTAVMLTDGDLIASSRVILIGDVQSVKAQWDAEHQAINTYVKVNVARLLKGELQNQTVVFKQLGGRIGDDATVIFGAPEYTAGQQVLLFLDTREDGTLRIAHLFQGKYDIVDESGTQRVKRKVSRDDVNVLGATQGPDITNDATLTRFSKKIKRVLRERAADVSAFAARQAVTPIVEVPAEYIDDAASDGDVSAQYTFLGNYRWFEPDSGQAVTFRVNSTGAPTGSGGVTEINQAFAAWTAVQTTALTLQNAGSTPAYGFQRDGVSALSFNDPLDQMSDPVGCSGTLAIGGVTSAGGSPRTIGGQSFYQIYEGDVVFNRNFSCFLGISANLAEVATHEIGHAIGFGHSSDYNAIMYATAHGNGRGATLGSDDIAAVTFLYPGSKGGPPPPTAPAAPSGLGALATSSSTISLTWADNSNNETGFQLERKTGAAGTYALIASPGMNSTSYSDSGLQASTTYYYRIRARNDVGSSAYSNEASATTQSSTPAANGAAFVSQTVPSALTTGQQTTVSITMRNSGTTTWTPGAYFLMSQNPAGNTTWGLSSVGLSSSVAPGASVTFTFTITAPATAGTYNFQWQMLQYNVAYFGAATTNVAISVTSTATPPPPTTAVTITTTSLAYGSKGVYYSQPFTATGGTTPYYWLVTSGALPPGLTLNANTGVLSGTPTLSGTFAFGVTVRDASGGKANRNFSAYIR